MAGGAAAARAARGDGDAEKKLAALRAKLENAAEEASKLRTEAGARQKALDREVKLRGDAEAKASSLERLCRELQLGKKQAELGLAQERAANQKRLGELSDNFASVSASIEEHHSKHAQILEHSAQVEAERDAMQEKLNKVLKLYDETSAGYKEANEAFKRDLGQSIELVGASEKRAAAAEAESVLLRKAKEASEARVAETLKAYEAMRESIDAVTKDMGGYAEKIKERDQIIAKQRGEMGRAADALRDSSEQRKDLIARAEKAEKRAQAMAGLCRKLKEELDLVGVGPCDEASSDAEEGADATKATVSENGASA